MVMQNGADEALVERVAAVRERLLGQIRQRVVGQGAVVELLMVALLARGHVLLTGLPGLGKTLLVRTMAESLSLQFKRIQFTPDLMPSDILGTEVVEEDRATGRRSFRYVPGPIFTQVLLADEINRTPPKTQAALLEAMEEGQVTTAGDTHRLPTPFFVLATQNPLELEGTYPLPEAQLDRFLFNVTMGYLSHADEVAMVAGTTDGSRRALESVLSGEEVLALQGLVRQVPVAMTVVDYAVRLASASRPQSPLVAPVARERVQWGAGSRAAQALVLGAKARALLNGHPNAAIDDVRALALPVLRHRIIPNFQAEADGVGPDAIITRLLDEVRP